MIMTDTHPDTLAGYLDSLQADPNKRATVVRTLRMAVERLAGIDRDLSNRVAAVCSALCAHSGMGSDGFCGACFRPVRGLQ